MTALELKNTVASNIKYFRKLKRMTQSTLAEKCELSVGYICDLESGHKWGTAETLVSISNTLDLSPYQLFIPQDGNNTHSIPVTVLKDLSTNLKNQIDTLINTTISEN